MCECVLCSVFYAARTLLTFTCCCARYQQLYVCGCGCGCGCGNGCWTGCGYGCGCMFSLFCAARNFADLAVKQYIWKNFCILAATLSRFQHKHYSHTHLHTHTHTRAHTHTLTQTHTLTYTQAAEPHSTLVSLPSPHPPPHTHMTVAVAPAASGGNPAIAAAARASPEAIQLHPQQQQQQQQQQHLPLEPQAQRGAENGLLAGSGGSLEVVASNDGHRKRGGGVVCILMPLLGCESASACERLEEVVCV